MLRMGYAFGMARVKGGFYTKEEMIFSLSEDEAVNEQKVKEFAEKHKCELVEVWYRKDIEWDKIQFYKFYNFAPAQIDEKKLYSMSIYR